MSRYLFDQQGLPVDFKLPASFLELMAPPELPDLDPWWFLAEDKAMALFWASTLHRLYPGRALLPFAKRDDSDDVACFDSSDSTGNPKVFYVHAFASPGWEHRGEEANFQAWLQEAKSDSERYKAEME